MFLTLLLVVLFNTTSGILGSCASLSFHISEKRLYCFYQGGVHNSHSHQQRLVFLTLNSNPPAIVIFCSFDSGYSDTVR